MEESQIGPNLCRNGPIIFQFSPINCQYGPTDQNDSHVQVCFGPTWRGRFWSKHWPLRASFWLSIAERLSHRSNRPWNEIDPFVETTLLSNRLLIVSNRPFRQIDS
jgi:hypothetical protein